MCGTVQVDAGILRLCATDNGDTPVTSKSASPVPAIASDVAAAGAQKTRVSLLLTRRSLLSGGLTTTPDVASHRDQFFG